MRKSFLNDFLAGSYVRYFRVSNARRKEVRFRSRRLLNRWSTFIYLRFRRWFNFSVWNSLTQWDQRVKGEYMHQDLFRRECPITWQIFNLEINEVIREGSKECSSYKKKQSNYKSMRESWPKAKSYFKIHYLELSLNLFFVVLYRLHVGVQILPVCF